jgi:arylsulfatase A-like enzyme
VRGIKRDLYEGGIREPTLARWPGHIQPGKTSDQVWAFWDFLPTAADLAGAPVPDGLDGISMVNAILGKPQRNHEYLYWEFHERGFSQAIRMGDWKGVRVRNRNGPIELYNLKEDLGETRNIAAQHPDVVAKISDLMRSARSDSSDFPVRET